MIQVMKWCLEQRKILEAKNEAVEIKPVDYGDPMYDHYNISSRVEFGNLFDF